MERRNIRTWLLSLALLLSVFVFSGQGAGSRAYQASPTQTEQLISLRQKPAVPYTLPSKGTSSLRHIDGEYLLAIRVFNALTDVALALRERSAYQSSPLGSFPLARSFSFSSDEDPSFPVRG